VHESREADAALFREAPVRRRVFLRKLFALGVVLTVFSLAAVGLYTMRAKRR